MDGAQCSLHLAPLEDVVCMEPTCIRNASRRMCRYCLLDGHSKHPRVRLAGPAPDDLGPTLGQENFRLYQQLQACLGSHRFHSEDSLDQVRTQAIAAFEQKSQQILQKLQNRLDEQKVKYIKKLNEQVGLLQGMRDKCGYQSLIDETMNLSQLQQVAQEYKEEQSEEALQQLTFYYNRHFRQVNKEQVASIKFNLLNAAKINKLWELQRAEATELLAKCSTFNQLMDNSAKVLGSMGRLNTRIAQIQAEDKPYLASAPVSLHPHSSPPPEQHHTLSLHQAVIMKGHSDAITCMIQLNNGSIATGSSDKTIRVWSPLGNCLQTLQGHSSWVQCLLQLSSGELVSASDDGSVKVWSSSGECLNTLNKHKDCVFALMLSFSGEIVSASGDKTIRLWNRGKNTVNTFEGHTDTVYCLLLLESGEIASGSFDSSIKVWNNVGYIKTLCGHTDAVLALTQLNSGELVSSSYDSTIRVWNKAGKCLLVLRGHNDPVYQVLQLSTGEIASGSVDCCVKIWNDQGLIKTLEGHQSGIKCLVQLESGEIVSGAEDGCIMVWDQYGECVQQHTPHSAAVTCVLQLGARHVATGGVDEKVVLYHLE